MRTSFPQDATRHDSVFNSWSEILWLDDLLKFGLLSVHIGLQALARLR